MEIRLEIFNKVPSAIKVYGPKQELHKIPGCYVDEFNYKLDYGVMPLTPLSIEWLKEYDSKIKAPQEVVDWFEFEQRRRYTLQQLFVEGAKAERLYDFQKRGLAYILMTHRMMLGDDPRLGKTVQSLVATTKLAAGSPIMILCLKSLVWQWADEVSNWTDYKPVVVIDRKAVHRFADINEAAGPNTALITNWETLRLNDQHKKVRERIVRGLWRNLIADEVHVVRNRKSGLGEAFMRLRPHTAVLASATMIERGPEDYFPMLRVINPKEFRSYWRWVGWYCETKYNGFGNDIVGPKNTELLRDHLAVYALGRKASEVADIPEKQFETISVKPTTELKNLYKEIEEEVFVEINEEQLTIPNALARMTRLRQVSIAPQVLGADFQSPKIEAIVDYISGLPSDTQIVLYTSFRAPARTLWKTLNENDISASLFIGGEGNPDEFKAQQTRVLISTPELGGIGQDYSNADVIVYADLPQSATILKQSVERTTKIGIKKPRLIVSVVCTAIDRAIAAALKAKRENIKDVDLYEFILARRNYAPST